MKLTFTLAAAGVGLAVALAVSATWQESDNPDSRLGSSEDSDPVSATIVGGIFSFGGLMALVRVTAADRDTPAGRQAATRWLGLRDLLATDPIFAEQPPAGVAIWDRHLAYGASLGVAHGAVQALPLGSESDTNAWSPVPGRWRLVRVRYPRFLPPGFGRHPARVALVGLLQLVVAGYVISRLSGLPDAIGDAVRYVVEDEPAYLDAVSQSVTAALALLAGLVVMRAASMLVVGAADLAGGRQWRVAVDDGSGDTVRAWRLFRAVNAAQGTAVRARLTRYLAHVKDLAPARPAGHGPGAHPAPGHQAPVDSGTPSMRPPR